MPTLSMFYGLIVRMYYFDNQQHKKSHFPIAVIIIMNPVVANVEVLPPHRLKLIFSNGETRGFDATPYLDRGVFKQLRDEVYLRQVRTAFGAIQWPNELDSSHDHLYLLSATV